MKQNFLKSRNETANGASTAWLDADYTLNLAIIYQDSPTREWAGKVHDRVAELVGDEAIHCTEWKVSDLREPGVYSQGAAALARADVIVVSLHEAERLPAVFYLWVNLWLQLRAGLTGMLVALVVPAEGSNGGARETRRYLCAAASQGRLEFLESNQPGEPIPGLREDSFRWAKAA